MSSNAADVIDALKEGTLTHAGIVADLSHAKVDDGQSIPLGRLVLSLKEQAKFLEHLKATSAGLIPVYLKAWPVDALIKLDAALTSDEDDGIKQSLSSALTSQEIADVLVARGATYVPKPVDRDWKRVQKLIGKRQPRRSIGSESFPGRELPALTTLQQLLLDANEATDRLGVALKLPEGTEDERTNRADQQKQAQSSLTAALQQASGRDIIDAFERGLFQDPALVFETLLEQRRLAAATSALSKLANSVRRSVLDRPDVQRLYSSISKSAYDSIHHPDAALRVDIQPTIKYNLASNSPSYAWRNCKNIGWGALLAGMLSTFRPLAYVLLLVISGLLIITPPALITAIALNLTVVVYLAPLLAMLPFAVMPLTWPVIAGAAALFATGILLAKATSDLFPSTAALTSASEAYLSTGVKEAVDFKALAAKAEAVAAANRGSYGCGLFARCRSEDSKNLHDFADQVAKYASYRAQPAQPAQPEGERADKVLPTIKGTTANYEVFCKHATKFCPAEDIEAVGDALFGTPLVDDASTVDVSAWRAVFNGEPTPPAAQPSV